MTQELHITSARVDPDLLDLPWGTALAQWPANVLAALPRGLSRHVVRFVRLSGRVIAIKEISELVAHNEYELLRRLERLDVPSVTPTAVITGRVAADGEPLEAVLITEHLQYSLPYRSLFSHIMGADTATRLIDALAVLLVRLHLVGFYWGDVSLSNTLFRRDAETFAAYLVDAETGALYPALTDGQRNYDVDLARTNIIGELMDLESGGVLDEDTDVIGIGDSLVARYDELWQALTEEESFTRDERWRVNERIERVHGLGFDVDELAMSTEEGGQRVRIRPKVVEAGFHSRRLAQLTGLEVQEHQARRLLADLEHYCAFEENPSVSETHLAHEWLTEVFEPAIRAVPPSQRGKLQPAQLFHEVLDHRWFLSQQQSRDVPIIEAARSYGHSVLPSRPPEQSILGLTPEEAAAADDAAQLLDDDDTDLEGDLADLGPNP
ncbi:DUF4032 domain-containing protein [Rarobacter faecitabidus]|uniref:Lipopolysaccharide kinase (Kdo/WaaP) family protein n=1 Tax=Rarobacter faecitabidus TaxID=13243 RepID=A0A542ZTR5_RARFA|nr:DUF4032 domain-containing protein [Rarobacter faecitabidus]TQL63707.1 lipopolysaccharide kinase (Kdo/WaaP) family protein [Rarobacter faecitabidus]